MRSSWHIDMAMCLALTRADSPYRRGMRVNVLVAPIGRHISNITPTL